LLPEELDARRVFPVEQLKEAAGQRHRDVGIESGHFAPANDLVVCLDFKVGFRTDTKPFQGRDLDGGGASVHLGGGRRGKGGVHCQGGGGGQGAGREQFAAVHVLLLRFGHRVLS